MDEEEKGLFGEEGAEESSEEELEEVGEESEEALDEESEEAGEAGERYRAAVEEATAREVKAKLDAMAQRYGHSSYEEMEAFEQRRRYELEAAAKGVNPDEYIEEQELRSFYRAEKERRAKEAFVAADTAAFCERYPGVDHVHLVRNEKFLRFAGDRLGVKPLGELYRDYVEVVGTAPRRREAAEASAAAKSARGTGSGDGRQSVLLTASEQKALNEWNRRYPEMKMSAREFKRA